MSGNRFVVWMTTLVLMIGSCLNCTPAVAGPRGPRSGSIVLVAEVNESTGTRRLAGMRFLVTQIEGIDPTTPAGMDEFKKAQEALDKQRRKPRKGHNQIRTGATDSQGRTVVHNLEVGAYLVEQVTTRRGAVAVATEPEVALKDMLVAIPSLDENNVLRYDVEVHLKPASTDDPTPVTPPPPSPSEPTPRIPDPTPSVPGRTPGEPGPSGPAPNPPSPTGPCLEPTPQLPPFTPGPCIPVSTPPTAPRIDTGGGSEFDGATQWGTIVMAGGFVLTVFFATRRRRERDQM